MNALPAVTVLLPMALTKNSLKTGTLTPMGPLVAAMLDVAVSVAVKVWVPRVLNVAVNVPVPLVSVALLIGKATEPSVLEKWTAPV